MDLTDIIDYFLPRLSPRKIRYIARMSWGRPKNLRARVYILLAELVLALSMRKPEKEYKWIDAEHLESGYPVTYHHTRLLIAPTHGIRAPRTYVLFNAMSDLLKKR
jgi:hypothetical protein